MAGRKQTRPQARQTNAPDAADVMPADDRRTDSPATQPQALPEFDAGHIADDRVGRGTTPKIDGGIGQHPVHDEDQEDRAPSDYEREMDRLDAATRASR